MKNITPILITTDVRRNSQLAGLQYFLLICSIFFLIFFIPEGALLAQRSATIGNVSTFKDTAIYYNRQSILDDTHVIEVFKVDTDPVYSQSSSYADIQARVGLVDKTNKTISWGNAVIIESDPNSKPFVIGLSSTQAVVGWEDDLTNDIGTAKLLSISGTTITTVGPAVTYHNGDVLNMVACKLSSSKFVVGFEDSESVEDYGATVVGEVSGGILSFGAAQPANASNIDKCDIKAISSTRFIFVYENSEPASDPGKAIIGDVSGFNVDYGPEATFYDTGGSISVKNPAVVVISSTKVVVLFTEDSNSDFGAAVVGTITGDNLSFGSKQSFDVTQQCYDNCADYLTANEFIFAYNGNSTEWSYINTGVVSDTITFGTKTKVLSVVGQADDIQVDALDENSFVIAYTDETNTDDFGEAIVGTLPLLNDAPTLTSFSGPVETTNEDTEDEITFAELAAQGDEADTDGTVVAFVVKNVFTGTLRIGSTSGTATAFAAGTNDEINTTNKAYWTPASNANGTLNAFAVVAEDDDGAESTPNVTAQVSVNEINDPPTLTSFANEVETTDEDTEVEITFAELSAQGNEVDVDGTVVAFVVQSVASGTLIIGSTSGTATAFATGTKDMINATNNAYWTPASNANGTLNAFEVVAEDDDGANSTGGVTVEVNVNNIDDEPTLTATGLNPDFANGSGAKLLYSGANASTIEAGQTLDQLILTVTNVSDGLNEILQIDGTNVELTNGNSVTTASNSMTVNVSLSGGTATVTIFITGGILISEMHTLINTLAYNNTAINPTQNNRVVTITSLRDNGSSSGTNDNLNSTLSITSTVSIILISAPSTQANTIIFPEVHAAKMSASWTNGNGDSVVVFVAESSAAPASPVDDTLYPADTVFGAGGQIGTSGWYCIYNGSGTVAGFGGLFPDSAYQVMACAYNEDSGFIRYNTSSATGNPATQTTNTILINEIDADTYGTDSLEFIELFDGGVGNISLDGLVLVLFNGGFVPDASYNSFDLDGYTTDATGYFVLGSTYIPESDLNFASATNQIQNGADAVALYTGNDVDFPYQTAVTTTNLIDAVVYDTNDATDPGLAPLLAVGTQMNEDERGDMVNHSLQRIPNGSSGLRDTTTFKAEIPTPGEENVALPIISIEGNSVVIADGDISPDASDHTLFPNAALDVGTSTRTYTINNDGIGELNISGVTVTGTNSSDFAVTIPPPSSIAANSSATFIVTFDPSAGGTHSATININNDDADMTPYNFDIEGNGIDISAPATQAHSITFSDVDAATLTASWTRGDGDSCAVFISHILNSSPLPSNDTYYSDDPKFGSGDEIATSGWYCVYNGTNTSINISGLYPDSTYRVMVCEYNEVSGFIRYNTSSASDNPVNQITKKIMINEVDADNVSVDSQEFIELYDGGTGNVALDGIVLTLFNGSTDQTYASFDLDGESTDTNGYYVIGNSAVSGVDSIFGDGTLQNGADAVALYVGDRTDFPNGTAITLTNLIDAIVYDNGQGDDAGLLTLLNAGEPQVDEDGRGDGQNHSIQRILNGTGGLRNTLTYSPQPPTPDAENYAYPEIDTATYDYNSNELVVTGNFFVSNDGASNDIDISLLTFTGEGGNNYTLTSTTDVEITSSTQFSVTLTGTDLVNVEALLNKNGISSATSGTTYNLSAADNWLTGSPTSYNISDITNSITVNNFTNPIITTTTYDADLGELLATGTNFISNNGADNDVDASLLTFTGEGGNTYTLTNSGDIDITSSTSFTLNLSVTDILNIENIINENGTLATDGTPYNLAAADNWMIGSPAGNNIADATTIINAINVNDLPVSSDTSVTSFNNDVIIFSETNFPYSDADGDNFAGIRIESLETDGELKYNGVDVTAGLDCPDVSLLSFNPKTDETGSPYAEFEFKVIDDRGGYSDETYTMTATVIGLYTYVTDVSCFGENDGSITVEVINGTPDFTYSWSTGIDSTTSSAIYILNELIADTYTLTFSDGFGALKTLDITVSEPTELEVNIIDRRDIVCTDDDNGFITIGINGGTPPYSILWSNKKTTKKIVGLRRGTYEAVVTDTNGCTTSVKDTIKAIDNIPPVAICKDTTIYLDNSGYSRIYPLDICGESTDNCEVISWMISRSIFTCDNLGSNEVRAWISDKQGNFGECFATVTIIDTIQPVVICNDTTLYLDASGQASLNTKEFLNAWDNCSFTVEPSLLSFDCSDISLEGGEIILPWINEFHYDNTGADEGEFIEIAGPAGTTLEGYSIVLYNGNNNLVYNTINLDGIIPDEEIGFGALAFEAQGLQNGPADGIALVAPDLSVLDFISYEGQLTAGDGPAIGMISTPVGVEESGDTPIGASIHLVNNFVWEAALVSSPGILNPAQPLPENEEAIEIVATDLSGNSSSCHINVTVLDTTPPVALCNDISIPLNENNEAVVTVEMIDNGSFDNCEIARIELNHSTFSCTDIGINQIILTVEDLSGNISTCEANVVILDTVPPTAICADTTLYLNSDGIVSIMPGDIGSLSFDNCGISRIELSKSVFNCDDIGNNQVTLIVEDMNGLTSECLATITIVDAMPPVMLCHDTTIYLNESGEASLNIEEVLDAYDNCSDFVIEPAMLSFDCNDISQEGGGIILPWINEFHYDNSDADQGEFIEVAGPAGTSLEGYSIVLYNGNNNLVYNTINLDGIIPDEGNGFGALAFDATGLQNGLADGIALVTPDLSVLEFISYEGQLTAGDGPAAGMISTPVGVEESGDTPIGASIHLTNAFIWEVALVSSPGFLNPGQPLPDANEAIEITATDLSGNSSSCNINITVLDTIPPVALCSDIALPVDINGLINLTPEIIDNGSFDNCGIAEMWVFPEVLSCTDAGESIVTLTVKDFSGNESTCLASVRHEDYFPPEGICLEVAAGLDENGEAYITPEMVDNGSYDNCGIAGMELSQSVFSCEDIGINQLTLTIEDINGLTSECHTEVTIFDSINPVVENIDDLTFYTEPGECETGITYPEIIFTDNCSATITQINGLGPDGVFPAGTTTEEYLIADASGNTVTLSFDIIIISPNLPPTIDAIPDVEVDEDSEISIILTGISDGGGCTTQNIEITAISEKSSVITDLSVNYIQGNSTAELTASLLPDWNGSTSIIVTVTGSDGGETSETINITVIPVNDSPYVLNPIPDLEIHAAHIFKLPMMPYKGLVFDDPDVDDILDIKVTTEDGNDIPDFILFSSDTIYISPTIQDTGLVSLIAIASDIEGATASDTFLIKVLDYETLSGITENNLNIKLYPNPTKGDLTLEIIDSKNNTADVIIYTSRGEMIFQGQDIPKVFKIDMTPFASGVYFLKINLDNKEYTRQFILNRGEDN